MTRYLPARHFFYLGIVAVVLAVFSGWVAVGWLPATIPAALFLLIGATMLVLASRPPIEVQEPYLRIGKRMVPWIDIRRVDRTKWLAPLAIRLTLYDDTRMLLLYPGDFEGCSALLRTIRLNSRDALIDGVPHEKYWGGAPAAPVTERREIAPPKFRVLLPEDEVEIERLYQRLKTVGHLDPKSTSDEK